MKSRFIPHLCALFLAAAGVSTRAAVVTGATVQNTAVNHSLTGTASQSSTDFGAPAERAIDGNVDGNFGSNSTTHTGDGSPQFWQVDLGVDRSIDQVVLYNRDACCPDRLSNYRVSVYDALNNEIAGQNFLNQPAGGAQPVNFGGITGRTVRMQALGINNGGNFVISLAEVTVLDYANYTNVAAGKPSAQSSTAFGGSAARANDGDTSGVWGFETVSHTDAIAGSIWWEVDLQGDYNINEIALHARTDCCADRQGNYRISILDNGSEIWGLDVAPGAAGSNIGYGALFSAWEDAGGFLGTGDAVRVSLIGGRNNSGDADPNAALFLMLGEVQVFGAPIPEPGSAALAALAGLALLRRRRR
jgi:uncharacterized protein (TIGR03382 family)